MSESRAPLRLSDIDVDVLLFVRQGDELQEGYIDPATGELYTGTYGEITGPDGEPVEVGEDWVEIEKEGSRLGYLDMVDFASAVADPVLARHLHEALEGRGAFRRFRAAMSQAPDEVREAWFRFRDARGSLRAVEWLSEMDLIAQADAEAATAGLAAVLERALRSAEEAAGALRLDVDEVPARWPEIKAHLAGGGAVMLTSDGTPYATIELTEPST